MIEMDKSEALRKFEAELGSLEKRLESGEITGPSAPGVEFERILRATLPGMTPAERDHIERTRLQAHQVGATLLAEHGLPVPGNDPAKPN
jgi:hypothetical protein